MDPVAGVPEVESFFHADTGTFTHVVYDREGGAAAIVDPVLDYDAAAARTSTTSVDDVLAFVRAHRLSVEWILETHAHADHLSAGGVLRERLGARLAIGRGITRVQAHFGALFGLGGEVPADGSQFDRLFDDGDAFRIGGCEARVIATPGHTVDGVTYLVGDAAFVGDTLFAPDVGTARADFPGADAAQLHASLQRILALPAGTRLFLCHDYPVQGRSPIAHTSIADERARNPHLAGSVDAPAYIAMRRARDAQLPVPRLLLPALQVNIRGGRLPAPDANGIRYLRLPLDAL
ncbi:MAG: MBL fold metallo-hydrolase [Lysobacteraceae bacterium]|nr:MAG: MBL fold metallo-hydrolase [Xanthomonadaceae bacterium]